MKKFLFSLLIIAVPLVAQTKSASTKLDGDDVYKNNCMRCHSALRQYSPRQTATIVNHMRVRANLTEAETKAVLGYLTENAPEKPRARARNSQAVAGKQAQP